MCRKKNTVNQWKGPRTLQGITTLSTLRQNSGCGVANDRTTISFSDSAHDLKGKKNFRYAVVVPLVVVLKVANVQLVPSYTMLNFLAA